MDENSISWICRSWKAAHTKTDWKKLSDQFHGAGMAIFHIDSFAALDYWILSDVATQRLLDYENEH